MRAGNYIAVTGASSGTAEEYYRYLPDNSNFGAGGFLGLMEDLASSSSYTIKMQHEIVALPGEASGSNETLTTSEVILTGFQTYDQYISSTWTGAIDSDWNTAGNWNPSVVPTSALNVTIPNVTNDPVISSNSSADCYTLTIESGATLTIESTTSILTGSLIVNGTATGDVNVQRFLAKDVYHYLSAPLTMSTFMKATKNTSGFEYLGLIPANAYDAFFEWDETDVPGQGLWVDLLHPLNGNLSKMDSETFAAGQGYCYADSDGTAGSPAQDNTAVFIGAIHNADVEYSASYNSTAGRGYHVVGNPFTAPLLVQATTGSCFLNDNIDKLHSDYAAAYVWVENSSDPPVWEDNYKIICNSGFGGVESEVPLVQSSIAVGQGFMVRVKEATTLLFSREAQVSTASTFYKAAKEDSWSGVQLFATSDNVKTSTLVGFEQNMTAALEPSYDVASMMSNAGANLYTTIAGNENPFAVQALSNEATSVNCGITVIEANEYTFTIYQELMGSVILEDQETGEMYNLLFGENCKIYLEAGTYDDRFVLHFESTTGLESLDENSAGNIYAVNKAVYLNGINGNVKIYDISGRLIKEETSNGSLTRIPMHVANGIYIVNTGQKSVKVVL